MDGGAGNDAIFGGNGADVLRGGDGEDFIDGNQGDDHVFLGAGDDTSNGIRATAATWSKVRPGPTMIFNGADLAEKVELLANGNRLRFVRDLGNVAMDLNRVERIDFNAFGGADTITVNDQTSTGLATLNLNLPAATAATPRPTPLSSTERTASTSFRLRPSITGAPSRSRRSVGICHHHGRRGGARSTDVQCFGRR